MIKNYVEDRKQQAPYEVFAIDGEACIMEEEHLGIMNGRLSVNATYRDVLSFRKLFAPPYVSSDFALECRLFGEKVRTKHYTWYPFEIRRRGELKDIEVASVLLLPPGIRAGILVVTLNNTSKMDLEIPVQFAVSGGLDKVEFLGFATAKGEKKTTDLFANQRLIKRNDAGEICVATNIENVRWEPFSSHLEARPKLAAGQQRTFHVAFGIGTKTEAEENCVRLLEQPEASIRQARASWAEKTRDLFSRVPRLETSHQGLHCFYYRALLPCLMNRWEVPEFVLNPYYSTGGVNGGNAACYLWDFGMVSEFLSLFEPAAVREHIQQFLKLDLTNCYAFSPIKGDGFGPWYPANQEKIVSSIYCYLLFTGDVGFLNEEVNGKTIFEWAMYHALYLDDLSKPVALVDYGNNNDHLELEREYCYDHYLPDLNGKRYVSLILVERMAKLAGKKRPVDFVRRARDLKRLITKKMWDENNNWFFFLGKNGERHTLYTFEILLLLGTGVLEPKQKDGLLRHLNKEEFLSTYGIHSISKKDPAYDQKDIDHGGGGAFTGNPPELIKRLYKSGHPQQAEDILQRILWWGERMPYWGDSMVANQMDYRRDTPSMNEISALAGAQCVIFGIFGVVVSLDGDVTINPQPPSFALDIALHRLKIRGFTFDIVVDHGGEYLVTVNGQSLRSKVGRRVVFSAEQRKLTEVSEPETLPSEISI